MDAIVSVTRKVVITINGVEHVLNESDWTESVQQAMIDNQMRNVEEIIDWVESY